MDIVYEKTSKVDASEELFSECADLFSAHYGKWGSRGRRPGENISLQSRELKKYLPTDSSWVATARINGALIGYGLIAIFKHDKGPIVWVTQLVVHSDYQNDLVGSTILRSAWGFSNHFAWGIVSANPFAIRALEKATKRRCSYKFMDRSSTAIKKILGKVDYLQGRNIEITSAKCVIDTQYFQDISGLPNKIKEVEKKMAWQLGKLHEGEEWIGVTFRNQKQERWGDKELNAFLRLSDEIAVDAYDRMAQANPRECHGWARSDHAENEVSSILEVMNLSKNDKVLDIGCGSGRHSVALAKKGFEVHGIDYSKFFIDDAIEYAEAEGMGGLVTFTRGDFRQIDLGETYKAAFCLYDVIGSSPEDQSNLKLIENAIKHLQPGGWLAISVMSYEFTRSVAKYFLKNQNLDEAINNLAASDTMQTTGDVFNPDFMLVDERQRVIYRKEEFDLGDNMPWQHIIRDRRYTIEELLDLFRRLSLSVKCCGYVRAGNFSIVGNASGDPSKEILLIAQKGLT